MSVCLSVYCSFVSTSHNSPLPPYNFPLLLCYSVSCVLFLLCPLPQGRDGSSGCHDKSCDCCPGWVDGGREMSFLRNVNNFKGSKLLNSSVLSGYIIIHKEVQVPSVQKCSWEYTEEAFSSTSQFIWRWVVAAHSRKNTTKDQTCKFTFYAGFLCTCELVARTDLCNLLVFYLLYTTSLA